MVVKVAVTGGVASGKTSLCHFLHDLGAVVVSADQIVHHLLLNDSYVQQAIIQLFGEKVILHGKPSRGKIAAIAFDQREKLEALEALLHPLVIKEIDRHFLEMGQEKTLFVAEVPLLFEAGMEKMFEETVTVLAPLDLSSKRFGDKEKFSKRVERQLSPKEKAKRSSIVVLNQSSLEDLRKVAKLLFGIVCAKS